MILLGILFVQQMIKEPLQLHHKLALLPERQSSIGILAQAI